MRMWILALFVSVSISFLLSLTFPFQASARINRAVIFSYLISNPSPKPIKNAYFYTYVPVEETSWQKVVQLEHTCENGTFLRDVLGNTVLECPLPTMAPFSNVQVDVRAWLVLKDKPEGKVRLKNKERFLGPQKYIESNDHEIKMLASRLSAVSTYSTSRRIFNWVKNNIHYKDYISRPLGALNALGKKTGDCTEGMTVFVALERANNIPSAGVSGYLMDRNGKVVPSSYHNWALFYANSNFRIADPKEATFDEKYGRYVAMTIIGKRKKGSHFPLGLFERFKVSAGVLRVRQL